MGNWGFSEIDSKQFQTINTNYDNSDMIEFTEHVYF